MLRSLFSGVSGLRSHQTQMDVVGNNIANVNTAGFKSSTVVFQDLLSQVLRGAGAPQNGNGGTNPAQVGLGVRVGGVSTNFAQGSTQLTGRQTDLAIQGDGFFVANVNGQPLYTRSGSFNFDTDGRLVTTDGYVLQGWAADGTGAVNTNGPVGDIVMPLNQAMAPKQTNAVRLGGNLPADATAGDPAAVPPVPATTIVNTVTVFDGQGTALPVSFTYTKTGPNAWSIQATQPDGNGDGTPEDIGAAGSITFDPATGAIDTLTPPGPLVPAGGQWDADGFVVDFGVAGGPDSLTQFSGKNSASAQGQDGSAVGFLQSFNISNEGLITGVFSNGLNQGLGQLALAAFNNPGGLEKAGGSMYRATVNSGVPQVGEAGIGGRGTLAAGSLEMSNVDLAQEFTNLIITQRGFQANSRVITTSDEILGDLINMKR